jgi:hypothetical protein
VEDGTPTATGARGGLEISVVGRGRFVVTLLLPAPAPWPLMLQGDVKKTHDRP